MSYFGPGPLPERLPNGEQPPYLYIGADQWWHCTLCQKVATEDHITGALFFSPLFFFAAKKAAWPRCSSVRLVSRSFGIMFPAWTGVSHTQLHDAQTCCCTQSLHVSSETTCVCSAMKK